MMTKEQLDSFLKGRPIVRNAVTVGGYDKPPSTMLAKTPPEGRPRLSPRRKRRKGGRHSRVGTSEKALRRRYRAALADASEQLVEAMHKWLDFYANYFEQPSAVVRDIDMSDGESEDFWGPDNFCWACFRPITLDDEHKDMTRCTCNISVGYSTVPCEPDDDRRLGVDARPGGGVVQMPRTGMILDLDWNE